MPFKLDSDVAVGWAALGGGPPTVLPVGDVAARRAWVDGFAAMAPKPLPGITCKEFHTPSADGHQVPIRWHAKDNHASGPPTPAVLFIHGGGLIAGSAKASDGQLSIIITETGIPMAAVGYRLAPEVQHPKPVEDCYAALQWLHANARSLNIDPARIAVYGESAGGGLSAAVSILAREKRGPAIAKQILIYPMLDDRTTVPNPHTVPFALWNAADNETGWNALLGAKRGTTDVPPTAAPARLTDFAGLPTAYIETGELDIFQEEILQYVIKLGRAGVSCEFHQHPGCPHAFEAFAGTGDVARRAFADRLRAIKTIEKVETSESKL
ncbi:alpha/beta hydrolase [Trichodelitschia bisporula]|uniref:Alpha/beta hydrolase n=1 Tax=Trichodelitschia bisporula TaxID=703511 RepID=A0A6G1I721_9PEZI|nr:alpha/beta hydrolase [Trichodelitschia bisporula]